MNKEINSRTSLFMVAFLAIWVMVCWFIFLGVIDLFWVGVIGYFYSVAVGSVVINCVFKTPAWNIAKLGGNNDIYCESFNWYAKISGWLERILYTTAFLVGKHEFVGVWLALKVASRWEASKLEPKQGHEIRSKIVHQSKYNSFIVGNAISILFAYMGSEIIKSKYGDNTLFCSIAVMLGGLVLYILSLRQGKRVVECLKPKKIKP